MDILQVNAKSKSYPIYLGGDFNGLSQAFSDAGLGGRSAVVVTDSNVAELYLDEVKAQLTGVFENVGEFIFEAGEASKTLATVERIYRVFCDCGLDRKSVVIALGGGVCGDTAGFAAATYMRGIRCVQIPTTLLSQVDSSVGGKTGVDFEGYKNIVGAFCQPEFVYINVSVLRTLPENQFMSGMGEVIKHGIIRDTHYFDCLFCYEKNIKALEETALIETVKGSCRIKADVVSQDETEQGLREILNFGHTFGHAVETFMEFKLTHGQCVALGILASLDYSLAKGRISEEEVMKCKELFERYGFLTRLGVGINHMDMVAEDLYLIMTKDKKSVNGKITIIGAEKIGGVFVEKAADKADILQALQSIF